MCNAGLMALDGARALDWLERIGDDNAQKEFYLPDAVEVARGDGAVCAIVMAGAEEVLGVNDRAQLAEAEAEIQRRLRPDAMRGRATLVAPETVFFSHDTVLGCDVVVEPHVVFGPGVTVGDGVVIHAFSHLEGASLASGVSIGPYARLRPGAKSGARARTSAISARSSRRTSARAPRSTISPTSATRHIGARANIGAGTITCNYDGFLKYRTDHRRGRLHRLEFGPGRAGRDRRRRLCRLRLGGDQECRGRFARRGARPSVRKIRLGFGVPQEDGGAEGGEERTRSL